MKEFYCVEAELSAAEWLFEDLCLELYEYREDVFSDTSLGEYEVKFQTWSQFLVSGDAKTQKNLSEKWLGIHRLESGTHTHTLGIYTQKYNQWADNPLEMFVLLADTAIHESCHVLQMQKYLQTRTIETVRPKSHGIEWLREMRNLGVHSPSPKGYHGGKEWYKGADKELYQHLLDSTFSRYQTAREISYEACQTEFVEN